MPAQPGVCIALTDTTVTRGGGQCTAPSVSPEDLTRLRVRTWERVPTCSAISAQFSPYISMPSSRSSVSWSLQS